MNSNLKTAIFWVVLIMLVVVFVTVVRTGQRGPDRNLTFTQFVHDMTDRKVKEVTVSGMEVHGTYTDGAAFHTLIPEQVLRDLQDPPGQQRLGRSSRKRTPATGCRC